MVQLARQPLPAPAAGDFLWAAGIEDTFITAPHPRTGRTLDEYELTGHYERWREDQALLADLGVSAARYGIPWHRICPRPGEYDWSWTDAALERLALHHGIEPIVDLVHYGAPAWMDDAFLHPDYPQYVAEFAHAVAERYRGICAWYTPLNEPRVNAWYCGRIGWWPPNRRSWRGFAGVMLALCRGICLTQRAILEAVPDAVMVHVDATDLYAADDPDDAHLVMEARFRQNLVFLALDLVQGRVGDSHPLAPWLQQNGAGESALSWFRDHAVKPDIIGVNEYPMFSCKRVVRDAAGRVRARIRHSWVETLEALIRLYAARYSPAPIMITETASSGSVKTRERWMRDSVEVAARLRAEGVRLAGYTWWPLFSLVTWAYRQGAAAPSSYLLDMGLWDLRGPELRRVPTPLVDLYRKCVHTPQHRPADSEPMVKPAT